MPIAGRAACPPSRTARARHRDQRPLRAAGRSESATPHQQQSPGLRPTIQVVHVEDTRAAAARAAPAGAAGRAGRPGPGPCRVAPRRGRRRSSRAGSRAGPSGRRARAWPAPSASPQLQAWPGPPCPPHGPRWAPRWLVGVVLVPAEQLVHAAEQAGHRDAGGLRPAAAGPGRSPWPGGPRRARAAPGPATAALTTSVVVSSASTRPTIRPVLREHGLDQQATLGIAPAAR